MPQLHYSLWYHKEAIQAVQTYTNLFPDSELKAYTVLPDTPSGDVDYLLFRLGELLSKVAEAEACGWCQDDFGISWQIIPKSLEKATFRATREEFKAMQAIYHPMKKLEIEPLATYLRD